MEDLAVPETSPTVGICLTERIQRFAADHPDLVAIRDGEDRVTYSELWADVLRLSAAMSAAMSAALPETSGSARPRRVALLMPQAAIDAAVDGWEPGRGAAQACAYEVVPISKFVTDEFAEAHPRAVEVLRNMTVGTETVRELAGTMVENELSPQATALHFFETRPDLWTAWLDDAEVTAMKKSLTSVD
jgi:acyl-CoA synthetase (AMP-forming)/AMP-acid ligase II